MSRGYWPHGTVALEGVLQRLEDGAEGRDWLTALGPEGEPLRQWRAALIDDLGGPDKVSVQQLAIVDITVRTYLFLEHIDHWLLNKPSIINKQKRSSSI